MAGSAVLAPGGPRGAGGEPGGEPGGAHGARARGCAQACAGDVLAVAVAVVSRLPEPLPLGGASLRLSLLQARLAPALAAQRSAAADAPERITRRPQQARGRTGWPSESALPCS